MAQYPILGTAQSVLHFTPWQTCSIKLHLGFSGTHLATIQLLREGYSYTNIHPCLQPCIHSYRCVNWSNVEWNICRRFYTAEQDSNPGPFSQESGAKSLHHTITKRIRYNKIYLKNLCDIQEAIPTNKEELVSTISAACLRLVEEYQRSTQIYPKQLSESTT